MERLKLFAVFCTVAAQAASAQTATTPPKPATFSGGDRDQGIYALTLLEMGITPRAVALGEAVGALEGDPSAIWYNAAGLASVRNNSISVTGSQRFGDSQLGGVTVALPTDIATFGIGARVFNAGTIEETENNALTGASCRAYQLALEGGGAMTMFDHVQIGGSVYYGQETLCTDSRGSIGVNAGALFPELFGRLSLGTGVRNWGTPVVFDVQSSLPPEYWYAAAAFDVFKGRQLLQTPMLFKGQPVIFDAKLLAQLDVPYKSDVYPALGAEGTMNGVVIGRIGYQFGGNNRSGLSLGAGINVGVFRLEYAFRNRQNAGASFWSFDPVGDEHHVSATLFWGGPSTNTPVAPVIITQPIDTAAINRTVRDAVARAVDQLRPVLDSLRSSRVEIRNEGALISRYVVPVHFAFDSSIVRSEDLPILSQIAQVIRQVYPTALVTIEGFADPAGTVEYNLRLSRRRAEAVRRVMVDQFGLPERQFRIIGYGEEFNRQVAPGARKNEPGAEENRRVTFTIDATSRF